MAKFNNNTRKDIGAMLAGTVIVSKWRNNTLLSMRPPPRKRKFNSPKQQESIDRFGMAHDYASEVLQSEDKLKLYSKGINAKRNNAHAVAHQDFLHPPVVHYVSVYNYSGAVGDIITVKATDDFRVESVLVEVIDKDGKSLEKGEAKRYTRKPFIWKYKTTVANKHFVGSTIRATAIDLPGNRAEWEGVLEGKGKSKS